MVLRPSDDRPLEPVITTLDISPTTDNREISKQLMNMLDGVVMVDPPVTAEIVRFCTTQRGTVGIQCSLAVAPRAGSGLMAIE